MTVDPAGLKSAYRTMARKHHPDVNADSGSEERFKQILEAYSVLSDQMQLQDRGRPTRTAVLFIRKVSDGERVFFKGKGGFGENGGDVGDLYVTIRVRQPQTSDRNQSGAAGTYGDEPMDLPGVTKLLKEWTF